MTLQDLRQFRSIRAEVRRISERMEKLRKTSATTEDEKALEIIKELYKELEAHHRALIAKELETTRQIEQINDAQVRLSIQMHYIDGKTWNEVADAIGGNNTDAACKQYVSRYLRKPSQMSH